jgi:hypothetical protein
MISYRLITATFSHCGQQGRGSLTGCITAKNRRKIFSSFSEDAIGSTAESVPSAFHIYPAIAMINGIRRAAQWCSGGAEPILPMRQTTFLTVTGSF